MLSEIRKVACKLQKTIVLPEGHDKRVMNAASIVANEGIAKIVILGDIDRLSAELEDRGVELGESCVIINPDDDPRLQDFADIYYELRKNKGLTEDAALDALRNPLYFGAMLVREGHAAGFVAGAVNTTADVLRSGLRVVGMKPGNNTLSACFIMSCRKKELGSGGILLFADSAVNPDPDAEMLADITIATAESFRTFMRGEPYIAMLSYSTKGSADGASVSKVREALNIVKTKAPDLKVDGEMQLDAAIIPEIAERKAPGSPVAGKANVLIFPDLNAGNIGYKLVEQFADAEAIGPIVQGFKKPVNDLSRGCNVRDIVNTVAFTCIQACTADEIL